MVSSPSLAGIDLAQGQKNRLILYELGPGRGSYPLQEKGNQESVGALGAQIMWNNVILPRAEGAMWLCSRTLTAGPGGASLLHSQKKGRVLLSPLVHLILAWSQVYIKLVTDKSELPHQLNVRISASPVWIYDLST